MACRKGDVVGRPGPLKLPLAEIPCRDGGCSRIRTYDPLIKSQLLYQLSYAPAPVERGRLSGGSLAVGGWRKRRGGPWREGGSSTRNGAGLASARCAGKARPDMARRDLTGAVDFGHLETYAGHDAELVEEVLGLFDEQMATWMRLLDPDAPTWRDAAHTVKGAALGVGAFQLAEACGAAEAAGEGASPAERVRLTEKVRDAVAAALHDIAA